VSKSNLFSIQTISLPVGKRGITESGPPVGPEMPAPEICGYEHWGNIVYRDLIVISEAEHDKENERRILTTTTTIEQVKRYSCKKASELEVIGHENEHLHTPNLQYRRPSSQSRYACPPTLLDSGHSGIAAMTPLGLPGGIRGSLPMSALQPSIK